MSHPTHAVVVEMEGTSPDRGIDLAIELKLVEKMEHGGNTYIRLTDDGKDVLSALIQLIGIMTNPDNQLKAN